MKASVVCRSTHQIETAERVIKGLRRHGVECGYDLPSCDFKIVWGAKKPFRGCEHTLVMERAYLGDRFLWTSLGWDGINGRAIHCNEDVPDDRWNKYWASQAKDPSSGNGYLVIGQTPGDATLKGVNIYGWYSRVIRTLKYKGYEWYFRPHPNAIERGIVFPYKTDTRPLDEALSSCHKVITYNSNVGVLGVMKGKLTTAENDVSMVWEIAGKTYHKDMTWEGREDWGRKISYCQWLPEELENGDFWPTLKRIFD